MPFKTGDWTQKEVDLLLQKVSLKNGRIDNMPQLVKALNRSSNSIRHQMSRQRKLGMATPVQEVQQDVVELIASHAKYDQIGRIINYAELAQLVGCSQKSMKDRILRLRRAHKLMPVQSAHNEDIDGKLIRLIKEGNSLRQIKNLSPFTLMDLHSLRRQIERLMASGLVDEMPPLVHADSGSGRLGDEQLGAIRKLEDLPENYDLLDEGAKIKTLERLLDQSLDALARTQSVAERRQQLLSTERRIGKKLKSHIGEMDDVLANIEEIVSTRELAFQRPDVFSIVKKESLGSKPSVDLIIMLSDSQFGQRVVESEVGMNEYGVAVFAQRMELYFQKLIRKIHARASEANITSVRFTYLGDIVEGNDIFPNQAFQLEIDAHKQLCC